MTLTLWPFLALLFSVLGAGVVGFNQYLKMDGRALTVGRFPGVLVLALVAGIGLPWPGEPLFYATAFGMGVLLAVADILLFDAAARYGGRLAALYVPMKMLFSFILWAGWSWWLGVFAVDAGTAAVAPMAAAVVADGGTGWWAGAVHNGLIVACFGLSALAVMSIRRTDTSWRALQAVVPVAVLYALGDVVAKSVLPPVGTLSTGAVTAEGLLAVLGGATAYLLMTNVAAALVGLVGVGLQGRAGWRGLWDGLAKPGALMWASAFGAYLYAAVCVLLLALALAPNPGYVGAVTMLSAAWLALWARYHDGERNNFWACLLLIASAVCLVLVTT